jgi:hypothetical protein
MDKNNFKRYLPSPEFTRKVVVLFVLAVIIFIIAKVIPAVKNKINQNNLEKTLMVKDLVIQDQNKNGIQDWEEALWGLDPSTDGPSNREYILAKKQLLNKDTLPEGELTEDDKMAREFFALVVSLQQSGNLNDVSMKALAESISGKIASVEIPDIYDDKSVNVITTTPTSIKTYYSALQKLHAKYKNKDIGGELALVGQAIANNDGQALRIAILTATDYRNFGQDLLAIPVPTSLVALHLELANNYEKNAQTLESMGPMLDNPVAGMSAITKYKKYNDALVNTIEKMATFFKRNGIIK